MEELILENVITTIRDKYLIDNVAYNELSMSAIQSHLEKTNSSVIFNQTVFYNYKDLMNYIFKFYKGELPLPSKETVSNGGELYKKEKNLSLREILNEKVKVAMANLKSISVYSKQLNKYTKHLNEVLSMVDRPYYQSLESETFYELHEVVDNKLNNIHKSLREDQLEAFKYLVRIKKLLSE